MRSVSDESEGTPNSSDDSLLSGQQLLDCDICGERFTSKKPLRVHINTHLRKLRIVLKRVANPKVVKVKKDTYWLDPEKTGLLKLTLKKQSIKSPSDSLKLTLKKSSESEDFTVVNNNFHLGIDYYPEKDVAGAKENDPRGDKAAENSINEPFENVMVDQQVSLSLNNIVLRLKIFSFFSCDPVCRMIMTIASWTPTITILWKRMKGRPQISTRVTLM